MDSRAAESVAGSSDSDLVAGVYEGVFILE